MLQRTKPPIADDRFDPAVSTTWSATIAVAGTTFHVERRGRGAPVLLIHGGGEDTSMLAAQAEDIADSGFEVFSYDRRGTGRSGRECWPGTGAAQHADDAAEILSTVASQPAVVLGVSSGAIVGLALAARHPVLVERVIAWEPPAAGVVPGGAEISAGIMAPIEEHLTAHPGDYVGAQALLLSAMTGHPVEVDDPALAATRAHAEPMIRDEPNIALAGFDVGDLDGSSITIGVGSEPNQVIVAATTALAELTGNPVTRIDGAHEVYLTDPHVLTRLVVDAVGATTRTGQSKKGNDES